MSVKLLVLKSYEDVIAEVAEEFVGDSVSRYVLSNPYITRLNEDKLEFYSYVPLAKDKTISIPADWVVTIVEPLDEVKDAYTQKMSSK